MDDFYLFLPSNSIPSGEIYPSNKPSSFRLKLAQPLTLHGSWEVGIAEIHFPFYWFNVDDDNNSFYILDKTPHLHKKRKSFESSITDIGLLKRFKHNNNDNDDKDTR